MLSKWSLPKERQNETVDRPLNSMRSLLTILDKQNKPIYLCSLNLSFFICQTSQLNQLISKVLYASRISQFGLLLLFCKIYFPFLYLVFPRHSYKNMWWWKMINANKYNNDKISRHQDIVIFQKVIKLFKNRNNNIK